MTKDDIIRMALEAGFSFDANFSIYIEDRDGGCDAELERFANLVAAAEREACAGLRKEIVLIGGPFTQYESGFWDALRKYEDAIRARSQS